MNKQPFYHEFEGQVLFTATRPLTKEEFISALEKGLKKYGLVEGTVELHDPREVDVLNLGEQYDGWAEPEAGDPHDLM